MRDRWLAPAIVIVALGLSPLWGFWYLDAVVGAVVGVWCAWRLPADGPSPAVVALTLALLTFVALLFLGSR